MISISQSNCPSPPVAALSGKPAGVNLQPGESGENFKEVLKKKNLEEKEKNNLVAVAAASLSLKADQPSNEVQNQPETVETQIAALSEAVQTLTVENQGAGVEDTQIMSTADQSTQRLSDASTQAKTQHMGKKAVQREQGMDFTSVDGIRVPTLSQTAQEPGGNDTSIPLAESMSFGELSIQNTAGQKVHTAKENTTALEGSVSKSESTATTSKAVQQGSTDLEKSQIEQNLTGTGLPGGRVVLRTAEALKANPARVEEGQSENPLKSSWFRNRPVVETSDSKTREGMAAVRSISAKDPVSAGEIDGVFPVISSDDTIEETGFSISASQVQLQKKAAAGPVYQTQEEAQPGSAKGIDKAGSTKRNVSTLPEIVLEGADEKNIPIEAMDQHANGMENARQTVPLTANQQGSYSINGEVKASFHTDAAGSIEPKENKNVEKVDVKIARIEGQAESGKLEADTGASHPGSIHETRQPSALNLDQSSKENADKVQTTTMHVEKLDAKPQNDTTQPFAKDVASKPNTDAAISPDERVMVDLQGKSTQFKPEINAKSQSQNEALDPALFQSKTVQVEPETKPVKQETKESATTGALNGITGNVEGAQVPRAYFNESGSLSQGYQDKSWVSSEQGMRKTSTTVRSSEKLNAAVSSAQSAANGEIPVSTVQSTAVAGERTFPASKLTPAHIQQIAHEVDLSQQSGKSFVRIQLHPQDLGAIDIHLSSDAQGVGITIMTEHASTGRLLEGQMDALRQSLSDAGLHLTHMNFSMKGQGDQGARQYYQNHPMGSNRGWFQKSWNDNGNDKYSLPRQAVSLTSSSIDYLV